MKATDHNRIVKQLNANHAAKLADVEAYWKQELADLQVQFNNLCEAARQQDENFDATIKELRKQQLKQQTAIPGVYFDPDKPMCQDDYEYFSGIMAGIVGSSKQA